MNINPVPRVKRSDVAKLAGVSTATVSHVLNETRYVSQDTKKKVLLAVENLKYEPDMIARSMKVKETKQLGIIVANLLNPYFCEIVHGFERAAREAGYFVNLCAERINLNEYYKQFVSRRLDGIFCLGVPSNFYLDHLYELVNVGTKIVMGGHVDDMEMISVVDTDYVSGMEQAVAYLYDLGHRGIAYLSGVDPRTMTERRAEGYLGALHARGLDCGERLLVSSSPPYMSTIQNGYNLTEQLMNRGAPFTAVICMNDLMAMGAMNALRERGYRTPEDVSVMGFDDSPFTQAWNPPITTMGAPKREIGTRAFDLLYANIRKGIIGYYRAELTLTVRASTGPVRP